MRFLAIGLLAAKFLLSSVVLDAVLAADATRWEGSEQARVRLVAGARDAEGYIYAGLQFDLAKGWKTYWREPGDSGIAPTFSWKASGNVSTVDVLWPAPIRFRDDFGQNNGYKKDTLLPIRIRPADASEPVSLNLALQYGVCRELCIPGRAELNLIIMPDNVSPHQALIDHHMELVPKPVSAVSGLRVSSVTVRDEDEGVFLSVELERALPAPVNLFVEGPDTYHFEAPCEQPDGDATHSRYLIRVQDAKSAGSLKGAELLFTAVQADLRLEQSWRLDRISYDTGRTRICKQ